MNHLNTLPSTGEQARVALLLLGAPAPARLVVDVHAALFDGDLSMAGLASLLRDRTPGFCCALDQDLVPVRGMVALDEWTIDRRVVTPAQQRADELTAIARIADFVALRRSVTRSGDRLLRELAARVPDGVEAVDLAGAARAALLSPQLAETLAAQADMRASAVRRAAGLTAEQQRYGIPAVPHQRGGE